MMNPVLTAGQDAALWLRTTVLPPLLEPGEQIGVIGYLPELPDFPIRPVGATTTRWWFESMRTSSGKPLSGKTPGFMVLTSSRVLFMPGGAYIWRGTQHNHVKGVIAIRWAAVREVFVPRKQVQKHFLNLVVNNPNRPGESVPIKLFFWHKEKGVASHEEFVARAGAMALERVQAARAAALPEPPLFFDVLTNHPLSDPPGTGAPVAPQAATVTRGGALAYGVVGAGLALPGAYVTFVAVKNHATTGIAIGVALLIAGFVIGKRARLPRA
jgi:hypothetical protein